LTNIADKRQSLEECLDISKDGAKSIDISRGHISCIKGNSLERTSCYCLSGEKFPRIASRVVNKLLLCAFTCMCKTFVSRYSSTKSEILKNTWGYIFTLMYLTSTPFWTRGIGPSYKVGKPFSTNRWVFLRMKGSV
jgi:hypothetical protein